MSARLKISTILLLSAVLYLYFVERKSISTDQKIRNYKKTVSIDYDNVYSVSINKLQLLKAGADYKVISPVEFYAEKSKTEQLFMKCVHLPVFSSFAKIQPDKFYGFDKPLYSISLKTDKDLFNFHVGKKISDSLTEEYYFSDETKPGMVFTVPQSFIDLLSDDYNYFIDSAPFSFIKKRDLKVTFHRDEKNIFSVFRSQSVYYVSDSEGCSWQGKHNKVDSLISIIGGIEIDFLDKIETENNEKSAQLLLSVSSGEDVNRKLYYLRVEDRRYIALDQQGPFFLIRENLDFLSDIVFKDYVGESLYEAPVNQLRKVVFQDRNGRQAVYYGDKMKWHLASSFDAVLSRGKILKNLLSFFIKPVSLPEAGIPVGDRTGRVIFNFADSNAKPRELHIFKREELYCFYNPYLNSFVRLKENYISDELLLLDYYKLIDDYPFARLFELASAFKIENDNGGCAEFIKNSLGLWKVSEDYNDSSLIRIIDLLKSARSYNAAVASPGVDFGFTDPPLRFFFYDKKNNNISSIKLGSFSTISESYFLGDNDYFIFCRDLDYQKIKIMLKKGSA